MDEKINSVIEAYLDSPNKTDYAIMINGVWGCGKTFYVEHGLQELIKSREMKYIYISLNGCDNLARIIDKITYCLLLREINASIDSDLMYNMFRLSAELSELNSTVNVFSKIICKLKEAFVSKKILANIETNKIVIIFDDVERISDDTLRNDIIGSIYENYTKKGYKTILVGDETNIKDKEYHIIKEKVIRRTISYEPNRILQFENFIDSKFKNSEYKQYLDDNKGKIIEYFVILKINNLRTISFIIDNFIEVFSKLDDEMRDKFGDYIFKNIMILTNEYKLGKLSINNLEDKNSLENIEIVYIEDAIRKDKEEKREKTYITEFIDKYLSIPLFEDFKFIDEIFKFILTGHLNSDKLKEEIKSKLNEEFITEEENIYRTLNNWRYMEEDELKIKFEKFINYFKSGKYHIFKFPYIYDILKFFQEKPLLPNLKYDIKKMMLDALSNAEKNLNMIPKDINSYKLNNESKPNDLFYEELKEKIKDLLHRKYLETEKSKIDTIYQSIISNDKSYYTLINDNSFFQDTIKTGAEHYIFKLPNRGISFLQYHLNKIMQVSNAGSVFYNEKSALEKIITFIEANIDSHAKELGHLRVVRLKDLLEQMKKAVEHLENTI